MKTILCIVFLCTASISFSQPDLSESNAKIIIGEFFRGFHERDTVRMKRVIAPHMQMRTFYLSKDGENKVRYLRIEDLLKAVALRPEDQKWDERLLDYKVQSDGNLAHVWTPYEFYLNDEFSHCGANSFTLTYTDEGWKILLLLDSRRIGSCDQ
ncbi:nuclear transport factor 2 family protein [Marixanthomonas spongiae]|uniref:3-methyl-2-oxobutanoate hydroxymethyltransferase n=1 Tax=Marixanthomonas spongiae TaxID=2174845 RepID=A0A2U0I0Z2_9FLAO|nr:nuclear transport factor 2 family protein [Marixanthomonas spongiae]PVW14766.1 3-methyl-2-oxobutanoate hydroxymethyltransferase [Marixanthomonas spongiae]